MAGPQIRSKLKRAGKETTRCLRKAALQSCKIALWVCCSPCICCAIVFLPQRGRGCVRRHKAIDPPRPAMPFPRQRALTMTSTTHWQEHQVSLDQPQSAFMAKLPLELRRMIYEKVLGEASIHLGLVNGLLYARRCPFQDCRCRNIDTNQEKKLEFGLPLLRTCRRIYSEAVEYLYTANYFSLSTDVEQLPTIQYLSYHMLPQRLELIRSLYVYWEVDSEYYFIMSRIPDSTNGHWFKSWDALTRLTGLRRLHITLGLRYSQWSDYYEELWKERDAELLEPIKTIIAPRDFVVTLPDRKCSTALDIGSSKCVLRLPGEPDEENNTVGGST